MTSSSVRWKYRQFVRTCAATCAVVGLLASACSDTGHEVRDANSDDGVSERDAGSTDGAGERGSETNGDAGGGDSANDGAPGVNDVNRDVVLSCRDWVDTAEGCVLSTDGMLIDAPLVGPMTVVAVEDIPAGACRINLFDASPVPQDGERATRIALQGADGTTRHTILRAAGFPSDLFHVGDVVDLSLQSWDDNSAFYTTHNQTFVLSRAGEPVFVASTLNRYSVAIPDWSAAGIQAVDDGVLCRGEPSMSCTPEQHLLRFTYAGESATLQPGDVAHLGQLTLVTESIYRRIGPNCDGKGTTRAVGYWLR